MSGEGRRANVRLASCSLARSRDLTSRPRWRLSLPFPPCTRPRSPSPHPPPGSILTRIFFPTSDLPHRLLGGGPQLARSLTRWRRSGGGDVEGAWSEVGIVRHCQRSWRGRSGSAGAFSACPHSGHRAQLSQIG